MSSSADDALTGGGRTVRAASPMVANRRVVERAGPLPMDAKVAQVGDFFCGVISFFVLFVAVEAENGFN